MQDFTRNWSVWRSCARTQSLERWITTLTGLGWRDTPRPPSAPAVRAKVCCGASTRSYGRSLALRTTLASFLTAPFTGIHHCLFSAWRILIKEPRVALEQEEVVSLEWEWLGLEQLTIWRNTFTMNLPSPASITQGRERSTRTDTRPLFTTGWQISPPSTQTIAMNLVTPLPLGLPT